MNELHNAFQKLPKVGFKAADFSYFSRKLILFAKEGIEETLIHKFKTHGRKPYKVDKVVTTLIKSFRLNSQGYNKSKILSLVNTHLKQMNHQTVSQSSVDRICDQMEFRNETDELRLGKKFANDNITPYLSRKTPDYAGGLYQIDSSPINIYYNNEGVPSYLTLCVLLDVYSRKIVGYSIGVVENFILINEAIKNAFINEGITPDHILVDNHSSYHSHDFKVLKSKLLNFGVNIRYPKIKNAKDKAHVERWFGTFQSMHLSEIYGFLGEGIRTKREGGRVSDEKTLEYRKLKNLHQKDALIKLIGEKINDYNEAIHSVTKETPFKLFRVSVKSSVKKINQYDIAFIFGKTKSIKVRKSKIIIKVFGVTHTYAIYDRKISNKVNRTTVKIHYDEFDLSRVFISTVNDIFIAVIAREEAVNIVPLNSEEAIVYQSHSLRNLRNTKQNFKEVYDEIKDGYEAINAIPILGINEDENLKIIKANEENLNDIEKKLLALKVINSMTSNAAYSGKLKTLPVRENDKTPFKLKKVR